MKIAAGTGVGAMTTGCTQYSQRLADGIPLRRLGRTDLRLTSVGYGAQHTTDSELIRYAIDQGINYIETAWGYGFGRPGNSAESVGKAISGVRDNVHLFVAYTAKPSPTSKAWVGNQFEQTLRDLATDYIDVFLWHQPETIDQITKGEHIDFMTKCKSEGKIGWCGITAHENQDVFLKHLAESSLYDVAVVAFNSNSPPELAQSMREAVQKGVVLTSACSPDVPQGAAMMVLTKDGPEAGFIMQDPTQSPALLLGGPQGKKVGIRVDQATGKVTFVGDGDKTIWTIP